MSKFLKYFARKWETENFPTSECNNEYAEEENIWYSSSEYLCLLEDPKSETTGDLRVLAPYLYTRSYTREVLCGWTDGPNVWDHCNDSIHGDSLVVVAWIPFRK